ncbi:MAG TPA: ATP-binding protein [Chitinophagaceae bacterium]|nr:ATP-binding protein [Chitinophagaceae bacterium]
MAVFSRKTGALKQRVTALLSVFLLSLTFSGQTPHIDSFRNKLVNATDTVRPFLLNKIAEEITDIIFSFPKARQDSLLHFAENCVTEAEALSRKLNYPKGIGIALFISGNIKLNLNWSNATIAQRDYQNALSYLKLSGAQPYLAYCFYRIAETSHYIGNLAKSIAYYDTAISSFLRIKDTLNATKCMIWQGHDYFDKGDYRNAYLLGTKALNEAQKIGDTSLIVFATVQFEGLFLRAGLPERAIEYLHSIIKLHPLTMPHEGRTTLPFPLPWALWIGGEAYLKLNKIDSAIYLSQFIPEDSTDGDNYRFYGQLYAALHQEQKAMDKFVRGFEIKKQQGHAIGIAGTAIELGRIYLKMKDYNRSAYYTNYGLTLAEKIPAVLEIREAAGTLSEIYAETGNYRQAYHYSQLHKTMNDSLASEEDRRRLSLDLIQNELNNQKQHTLLLSKENELNQQQLQNERLLRNLFIAGAVAFLGIAIIMFRNYKQKQKANSLLEKQKKEIQDALSELKATQAQLIQSEKMASLGQLTAGIAHEIQNPLNFVNNFSEVNTELVDEANLEIEKGNINDVRIILNDIKDNALKINHHGKRAGAIVKAMLQHSRTTSGQKEPTDINALVDEYVRLAYHGLRAKDKSFNSKMETDFDTSVGKINVVPQDIGRVILNLINNAFYAVEEKRKQDGNGYEPVVTVSTHKNNGKVEIRVADNGKGIPPQVREKIFQPFFTTKPTGQGTGLGLSLSYDIVKSHGGKLKVETRENEGTVFMIELPISYY